MRKIKKIAGIVLLIAIAFCYAHVDKAEAIYNRMAKQEDFQVIDLTQNTIEQEFVCREDTLQAIQIKLQKLSEEGSKVKMSLIDCDAGETVASSELDYGKIKNGKFNRFSFNKIEGCNGKRYRVVISAQPIAVYTQLSTEKDTELKINSEEREGTLISKSVTHRFDMETFCVFLILVFYVGVFFQFLNRLFSR